MSASTTALDRLSPGASAGGDSDSNRTRTIGTTDDELPDGTDGFDGADVVGENSDGGIIAESVQSVRDLARITSPAASNAEETGDPFATGDRTVDAGTPGDNPENDALEFEQDVSDTAGDAVDEARNLGPDWLDELAAVAVPLVVVLAVLVVARPLLTIVSEVVG